MLTVQELKAQAEALRKVAPRGRIKYDAIDRCWLVKYDDGEFDVTDAYRLTANRGWVLFSTIKTEI